MGLFTRTDDTFRIDFGERGWVDVRSEIAAGDREYAMRRGRASWATTVQAASADDGDEDDEEKAEAAGTSIALNVMRYQIALCTRMIVAWSEDAPIKEVNVARLPDGFLDKINEEITARQTARTAEERGPLLNGSPADSTLPESSELTSDGQPALATSP